MIGLDTSVVLRLLTGEPAAQTEAARALLDAHANDVFVSDLVIGESYFALLHHYRTPHADAVTALRRLLEDGRVRPKGVALEVLRGFPAGAKGPGLMDRLVHGDYRSDGIEPCTFDRPMGRLPGTELIV